MNVQFDDMVLRNRLRAAAVIVILLGSWLPSNAGGQSAEQLGQMRTINPDMPDPLELDPPRIDANGISVSHSRHLTLLSDVRQRDDVAEFGRVFDKAVGQWCQYFDVAESRARHWHLRAMIIADRKRFERAGLFPNKLPDFLAGFQSGHEMWVYLQPGSYYTRHLLLHEGTHSFMQWFLGGTGAPWYSEGMAELLGVHSFSGNQLILNHQLTDRNEAEYWGRVKLILEDCRDGNAMSLDEVFTIDAKSFRQVRYYAWSWAACQFLSRHPRTGQIFRQLRNIVTRSPSEFNAEVIRRLAGLRPALDRDWELFIHEIDYGYDIPTGRLRSATVQNSTVILDSRYSWQMTDVRINPGDRLAFNAEGQFVVAQQGNTTWPCEAGGVTIDYYSGHPLGTLMVAVLPETNWQPGLLSDVQPVGRGSALTFGQCGWLAFRINESPSKMFDNEGELTIRFKKLK